jgi:DNA-directed RNA polymerase subunit beta'
MRRYAQRFSNATTDTHRSQIAEQAQGKFIDLALQHPGTMTQQVKSGARGNPIQYAKIVASPANARDPYGKTVPWLIQKSYSEGLSAGDYWAAGNEAILDTIKSTVSVSEPGELSKILINNVSDLIITEPDCGTANGIMKSTGSTNIIDRHLSRDTGGFRAGTLVTSEVQNRLLQLKAPRIMVRSPMTCEAGDGVCQKCQGLDEKGHTHEMGTNVGIRAAQAISEPLVQFALNAKHGVRSAKAERVKLHGIAGFRQTVESPRQFLNKATLAEVDGTVDKIERAPQGGHFVHVGKAKHYVIPNLNVVVQKGTTVEHGDVLSEGIAKPDEVVKHKGLGTGRLYMVNTLKDIYRDQGYDLDQRHFELLAKGELNNVRILDDPSNNFIKGDIVNYNNFRKILGKDSREITTSSALGETLGKEYLHYSAGKRVTPSMVTALKKEKINNVYISPRAPEVEFVMKPATRAPLFNPDWMARLAHRNLKSTLQQAAHFGDISNLHGIHPVPAYAFGAEFGTGEKGRY